MCHDAVNLAVSKDPRKGSTDVFARLVNKPEAWLELETPQEGTHLYAIISELWTRVLVHPVSRLAAH